MYDYLPASHSMQEEIEPLYEEFLGWKENTQGKRLIKALPTNLIKYIDRLEKLIGVPIHLISTSPNREEVIKLKDFGKRLCILEPVRNFKNEIKGEDKVYKVGYAKFINK